MASSRSWVSSPIWASGLELPGFTQGISSLWQESHCIKPSSPPRPPCPVPCHPLLLHTDLHLVIPLPASSRAPSSLHRGELGRSGLKVLPSPWFKCEQRRRSRSFSLLPENQRMAGEWPHPKQPCTSFEVSWPG